MPRSSVSAPDDNTPARQFLFIDSSTDRATSGEAVRVHVMRQSHRSRREQSGQPHRTRTPDEITILDREVPQHRRSSLSAQADLKAASSASGSEVSIPMNVPSSIDWIHAVKSGLIEYPHKSLSDLEALADAYQGSTRLLQADVLKLCRGDPLALSSYLALAAFQHCPDPQEGINVASALFEAGALEKLQTRILWPETRQSDTTMLAVLLLSRVEELKGSMSTALQHRNALRSILQDRGGLDMIALENRDLFNILSGADMIGTAPNLDRSGSGT